MTASPAPDDPERPDTGRRVDRGRVAAVLAGVLLDLVDLATMGPIGLYGGFVFGAAAGWWAGRELGFTIRARWLCALGGAVYAATPATEFVPLGTLAGALIKLGPRDHPS